jgi:hypothetical protein
VAKGEKKYYLSIVIGTVDKTTARLADINKKWKENTASVRELHNSLKLLGAELGLGRLAKSVKHLGHAFTEMGHAFHKSLGRLERVGGLAALVGGLGGAGAWEMFTGLSEQAKAILIASNALGVNTLEMQKWHHVARMAGIDLENFNRGMYIFGARVGQLRLGTGGLLEILRRIPGNAGREIYGRLKDSKTTPQALEVVLDAMERIKDVGVRLAIARAAFGRQAQLILELAEEGMPKLLRWMREGEERGMFMSERAVEAGARFYESWKAFRGTLRGLAILAGEALFDKLSDFLEGAGKWIVANRKEIKAFFDQIRGALPTFDQFKHKVRSVYEEFRPLIWAFNWIAGHLGENGKVKLALIGIGAYIGAPLVTAVAAATLAVGKLGNAFVALGIKAGAAWGSVLGPALVAAGILSSVGIAVNEITKWQERQDEKRHGTDFMRAFREMTLGDKALTGPEAKRLIEDLGAERALTYFRTGKVPPRTMRPNPHTASFDWGEGVHPPLPAGPGLIADAVRAATAAAAPVSGTLNVRVSVPRGATVGLEGDGVAIDRFDEDGDLGDYEGAEP